MIAFVWLGCAGSPYADGGSEHTAWLADRDGDGFVVDGDCDDADATTFPGAPDPEGDGRDQDCDGGDGVTPMITGTRIDGPPDRRGFGNAIAVGDWDGVAGDELVVGSYDQDQGEPVEATFEGVVQVRSADGVLLREWVGEERQGLGDRVVLVERRVFASTLGAGGVVELPSVGTQVPVHDGSWLLGAGDVGADGTAELATTDERGSVVWWAPYDASAPRVELGISDEAALVARPDGGAAFVRCLESGRVEWWAALSPGEVPPPTRTWAIVAEAPRFAAGDLDGDGVEELVVTSNPAGRVVVPSFVVGLEPGEAETSASVGLRLPPSFAGWPGPGVVQVADLDGDGQDDLLLSFYSAGFWSRPEAQGRVAVWFGPLGPDEDLAAPDLAWRGEPDSDFGDRLVVGDVDADGQVDLVVGAPMRSVQGGGAVYVIRGPLERP
jgi:hypothetical protein